jgi:hypothetical protein
MTERLQYDLLFGFAVAGLLSAGTMLVFHTWMAGHLYEKVLHAVGVVLFAALLRHVVHSPRRDVHLHIVPSDGAA